MASILRVGNSIRAQIRRAGHPTMAKNFHADDYKTLAAAQKAAEEWVIDQEADIRKGKQSGVTGQRGVTVAEAMMKFIDEKPDTDPSMISAMRSFAKADIGKKLLYKWTEEDMVKYIKDKDFSLASGEFHFSSFCSVIKRAKMAWKYAVPDTLKSTRERLNFEGLIGKSQKRKRRPTSEEIQMLLDFSYPKTFPMDDIIRFAMVSAMRCSEITRIERSTFNGKTVVITDRKHPTKKKGNDKEVPLLPEAIEIIERQLASHDDDRIFPYRAKYISEVWIATCEKLGIVDLHFHDLRHEATSRLFELDLQPQQVRLYTGHEDLNMLMRYTHLDAKDMADIGAAKDNEKKNAKIEQPVTMPTMDEQTMKEFEEFKRFKKMQEMMAAANAA
jgi:integrase